MAGQVGERGGAMRLELGNCIVLFYVFQWRPKGKTLCTMSPPGATELLGRRHMARGAIRCVRLTKWFGIRQIPIIGGLRCASKLGSTTCEVAFRKHIMDCGNDNQQAKSVGSIC